MREDTQTHRDVLPRCSQMRPVAACREPLRLLGGSSTQLRQTPAELLDHSLLIGRHQHALPVNRSSGKRFPRLTGIFCSWAPGDGDIGPSVYPSNGYTPETVQVSRPRNAPWYRSGSWARSVEASKICSLVEYRFDPDRPHQRSPLGPKAKLLAQ